MTVLIRYGDREVTDGLYSIAAIHYRPETLSRPQRASFDKRVLYIPAYGNTVLVDKQNEVLYKYQADREYDEDDNLISTTYIKMGMFEQFYRMEEVEQERVERTEIMPFTIPSTSTDVEIKIAEQPPNKPRQTWLSGASTRALAAKVEGTSLPSPDNVLRAADDSEHTLTEDDWVELGKALHAWVKSNIDAANQHIADIKSYTDVNDVLNHNLTQYWP